MPVFTSGPELIFDGADPFQGEPQITAMANGQFFVAWVSANRTGGESSVLGQIVDASGYKVGPEHSYGFASADNKPICAVTALSNGNAVIVATCARADYSEMSVRVQLLGPDGAAIGLSFSAASNLNGLQNNPSVTELTGGRFLVSWTTSALGTTDIHQQVFAADGAAIGAEQAVTGYGGEENNSTTIGLANGGFVTAYVFNQDIKFGIYGPNGEAPFFHWTANAALAGSQVDPHLAALDNGNFVVAWVDDNDGPALYSSAIRLRIYSPINGAVTGEITVNQPGQGGFNISPAVSALDDGRFVVVWTENALVSMPPGVKGQIFNADGSVSGPAFTVDTGDVAQLGSSPEVTTLADGRFAVTWSMATQTDNGDVHTQIFDAREQGVELVGTARDDHWVGSRFADFMDGGAGADDMRGGFGDDNYTVDNAGDVVREDSFQGYDSITTTIDWKLGGFDSIEWIKASYGTMADISITGNGYGQSIHGNSGNNALYGLGGHDIMYAGIGNDIVDGGTGADLMNGSQGSDIYFVDNAGDIVEDDPNPSNEIDLVYAAIDYALTANVENLILTGAALRGTGNALANAITGTTSANVLSGLGGNDTLSGGAGNDTLDGGTGADILRGGTGSDTYLVDNAGDRVEETAGRELFASIDTIKASISYALTDAVLGNGIENLTLTGKALSGSGNGNANTIVGNAMGNMLAGGGGNDVLVGGTGRDMLSGGLGSDRFVFTGIGDSRVTARDIISDFSGKTDHIDLSAIDAKSATLTNDAFSFIGANAFTGAAGQVHAVFDGQAVLVEGDVNGDRIADFQIELGGHPLLVAGDFIL